MKELTSEKKREKQKKPLLLNFHKNYRINLIINGIFLVALILFIAMGIAYLISLIWRPGSGFTIKTLPNDKLGNGYAISLSETRGFSNPTVVLSGIPIEGMDNITYAWLPLDELDNCDGAHNGENYLAYSFYYQNSGRHDLDLNVKLKIIQTTLGVDEAVRVMIYRDGIPTIYAKENRNNDTEVYPEGIVNFLDEKTIFSDNLSDLSVGEIHKYTIIIWLEGEDPECIDNIKSSIMRLELDFDIVNDINEDEE